MAEKPKYDVFVMEPLRNNPAWPFIPSKVYASWKNCTDVKEHPQKFNGVTFVTAGGIFTAIKYDAEFYTIGICYLGTKAESPATTA